ncbi:DUF3800 domain-containing protein [Klebsiella pneumoniae]
MDKPYQDGGSSRFLVLASVMVPVAKTTKLERIIRGMYKNRGRATKTELKSVHLSGKERAHFARELVALAGNHPDIRFAAIAVEKANVCDAFRRHTEGLYNYMAMTMLVDEMGQHAHIDFIPDQRDVAARHKHAMHDFLLTNLACRGYDTRLATTPSESKGNLALQFADYLAALVWGRYEFGSQTEQQLFATIQPHVKMTELYFSPPAVPVPQPVQQAA